MIRAMPNHDAVLFDLDGVLVDSRVPFARSVNSALGELAPTARPMMVGDRKLAPSPSSSSSAKPGC
jgi:beta-phosphoglucomutase-like phosphatase (HAD superfamily)